MMMYVVELSKDLDHVAVHPFSLASNIRYIEPLADEFAYESGMDIILYAYLIINHLPLNYVNPERKTLARKFIVHNILSERAKQGVDLYAKPEEFDLRAFHLKTLPNHSYESPHLMFNATYNHRLIPMLVNNVQYRHDRSNSELVDQTNDVLNAFDDSYTDEIASEKIAEFSTFKAMSLTYKDVKDMISDSCDISPAYMEYALNIVLKGTTNAGCNNCVCVYPNFIANLRTYWTLYKTEDKLYTELCQPDEDMKGKFDYSYTSLGKGKVPDAMLFPYTNNDDSVSRWKLVVVYLRKKKICIYDPSENVVDDEKLMLYVLNYICLREIELNGKIKLPTNNSGKWTLTGAIDGLPKCDPVDSGIYVILYCYFICYNLEPSQFSVVMAKSARRQLAVKIIKKGKKKNTKLLISSRNKAARNKTKEKIQEEKNRMKPKEIKKAAMVIFDDASLCSMTQDDLNEVDFSPYFKNDEWVDDKKELEAHAATMEGEILEDWLDSNEDVLQLKQLKYMPLSRAKKDTTCKNRDQYHGKYPPAKKGTTQGKVMDRVIKNIHVSWVQKCFNPVFVALLKSVPGFYLTIPAGSANTELIEETGKRGIYSDVKIPYPQGEKNHCLYKSMACGLYHYGYSNYADIISELAYKAETLPGDAGVKLLREDLVKHVPGLCTPIIYNRRGRHQMDVKDLITNQSHYPTIVIPHGLKSVSNHAICVIDDLIYDPRLPYALILNEYNLHFLCGEMGISYIDYAMRFHRSIGRRLKRLSTHEKATRLSELESDQLVIDKMVNPDEDLDDGENKLKNDNDGESVTSLDAEKISEIFGETSDTEDDSDDSDFMDTDE